MFEVPTRHLAERRGLLPQRPGGPQHNRQLPQHLPGGAAVRLIAVFIVAAGGGSAGT